MTTMSLMKFENDGMFLHFALWSFVNEQWRMQSSSCLDAFE